MGVAEFNPRCQDYSHTNVTKECNEVGQRLDVDTTGHERSRT